MIKKKILLTAIANIFLTFSIIAEEPTPDFVRTMCTMKANLDFFPQMIVKNFLEKNKGHEDSVMDLVEKSKELMKKDRNYMTMMYIFKDFSQDEMSLYMTLKWSDFMKKVERAETRIRELELPTYEQELLEMIKNKNID